MEDLDHINHSDVDYEIRIQASGFDEKEFTINGKVYSVVADSNGNYITFCDNVPLFQWNIMDTLVIE